MLPAPKLLNLDLIKQEQARRQLLNFTKFTFPDYEVNWHHALLCRYLDEFAQGKIKRLLVFMPPRFGKALEVHTPIATPTGWKEIGELQPGDEIYAGDGSITAVIAVSPVFRNRPIFCVMDDTGQCVNADAEHEWLVTNGGPVVCRTTAWLAEQHKPVRVVNTDVYKWHHIIAKPCGNADTKCIQVAHKSKLFLAGKGRIPTHNSELVSRRLPAYLLGRNPDLGIIACSYSQALAGRMNRDVQRIIDDERYQKIFPETKLFGDGSRTANDRYLRNTEIFEIVGRKGYYRSAGVLGSITGMGMNCFPAGTMVTTEDGLVEIEKICAGGYVKRVLSYNHKTCVLEWRRIIATAVQPGKPLVDVILASGCRVRCTADHPIFIQERGYRQARDLVPGEAVIGLYRQKTSGMSYVRKTTRDKARVVQSVLPENQGYSVQSSMQRVWQVVCAETLRSGEECGPWVQGHVLLVPMQLPPSRSQKPTHLQNLRSTDANQDKPILCEVPGRTPQQASAPRAEDVPGVRVPVYSEHVAQTVLLSEVCRCGALEAHEGQGEQPLQDWNELCGLVYQDASSNLGTGRELLCSMRAEPETAAISVARQTAYALAANGPSYQYGPDEQCTRESDYTLLSVPRAASQDCGCWKTDTVSAVARVGKIPERVYDIQVEGNSNFFANGVLVHNCGIIDDIFKSRAEAASEVQRENVWEWYTSTFYTRLEKNGQILITLTRWHEDDLAGKLIRLAQEDKEADQWVVLSLSAECDEKVRDDPRELNEFLWPNKYSDEEMRKIKATIGSYEWAAMYQQRPAPAQGGIFKRDWWRYYNDLPRMDEVVQSWDLAFKDTVSSAFVVGQVWGRKGANKYLIDQHREKLSFLATIEAIRKMTAKYPQAIKKLVEDKANGPAVIDTLKNEIVGLIAVDPEGGKEARAYAVSAQIESGNVYLPDKSIAPWVDTLVDELCSFPSGRFKDQTDALTQALRYLEKNAGHAYSLDINLTFGRRESPWGM